MVIVMNKVKRFIGTSGVYFIGNVLSKLIAFILIPIYTSKLSPEQFGTFDLIVTIVSFFAPIAFFQIWDGMFRFSFDKIESYEKYKVISNAFLVWLYGFFVYLLIFGILHKALSFENDWLVLLYGLSIAIQYQYTFVARVFLKNKLFVISGLVNSVLSASINIVLLLKYNLGIESLYIAPILGSLVQVMIIEIAIHPMKKFNLKDVNISQQLEMLKFSIPLCIAAISYWLLSGFTKVVIAHQLGNSANGLFAVANRFTSMIILVVTVFQYAWNEMAYLMANDTNRSAIYEKSIMYIYKVLIIGSGIFMLFIKIIFPYIINSAYEDALMIVPLSLIGVSANAFSNFIGTIFMTEKKTRLIFTTTIISAVINIVCLWVFTPIWGLSGAVGALCLSFLALALIRIYSIKKLFKIGFSRSYINYLVLLISVVCLFFSVNNIILLVLIIIILTGIACYSLRDILLVLWGRVFKK